MAMAIPHGVMEAIQSPGTQAAVADAARRDDAAAAQGLAEAAGSAAAAIGAFTAAPLFAALGAGPAWLIAGVVMAGLLVTSSLLDRPRFVHAPARRRRRRRVRHGGREPRSLSDPYCRPRGRITGGVRPHLRYGTRKGRRMSERSELGRATRHGDGAPWLPPGRYVWLPGRGRTFVRELAGPPGAPVLVLLHGWTATADLNWYACFAPLAEHFRVVAIDHRGHGRGLRSAEPFRLEQCADDVAALARELGIDRFVPVGYSMGGPIAQLIWQRHRRARRRPRAVRDERHVHRHGARAGAVRRRRRHQRDGRRRADRQGHERRAGAVERLAPPAGLPVVGLRRGRPPRLGADRRGRAGDRPLRLAALARRGRRARPRSS